MNDKALKAVEDARKVMATIRHCPDNPRGLHLEYDDQHFPGWDKTIQTALSCLEAVIMGNTEEANDTYAQMFDYLISALGYHGFVQEFNTDNLGEVAKMAKKLSSDIRQSEAHRIARDFVQGGE